MRKQGERQRDRAAQDLGSIRLMLWLAGMVVTLVSQPGWAQTYETVSRSAITVEEELAQAEESLVQITDVRLEVTEIGLQMVLETANGELSAPTTATSRNALILEISNAVLVGEAFEQFNPAEGIALVQVSALADDRVQVVITGADTVPEVMIESDAATGLTLSVVPGIAQAASADGDAIRIVVTGEQDEGYFVPNASTATRTDTPLRDIPASIQVIPQEVIQDQGATNIREVVRNVSGVTFADAIGNRAERFNLRGFQAEQFRNGFRNSTDAATRTQIDLANIERVEILKGPASVLFGRAEPSGIINYITKQPLSEPYYNLEFTAGDFDFYRPTLDISGPLTEDETLGYRLNVAYENAGSFRDFLDTERIFIAPTLAWQISPDTRLSAEFSYLNDDRVSTRGLPVLSDNEVADIPLSRTFTNGAQSNYEQTSAALYFDHRFDSALSFRSAFLYNEVIESGDDDASIEIDDLLDDRTLALAIFPPGEVIETYNFQNELTAEFNTGSIEHTVLLGLEYIEEQNVIDSEGRSAGTLDIFNPDFDNIVISDEVNFDFNFESDLSSFGIYLQDQITLLENLKLVIGGRFDTYTIDSAFNDEESPRTEADAFSPRLGIVYQPIPPVSLYGSYTTSLSPNFGIDINGEQFDPRRGTAFEVGVKTEIIKDRLFSTLAFYDTTLTNVTTENPDNPNFEIATGEQNSRGIELDIAGEILPGWNIFAGYAYTDAEVTEDNIIPVGNRLANVPEHSFNLWTTYTLQTGDLEGLGFGAGVFHVGGRAGDLDNSFFLDDYTRVDAALFYKKENYRFALNFKNLFDIDYFEGAQGRFSAIPGAPFNIQASVSVEF